MDGFETCACLGAFLGFFFLYLFFYISNKSKKSPDSANNENEQKCQSEEAQHQTAS
jgi:hypothetical protein